MKLMIYLAGQIHDSWREDLRNKAGEMKLNVDFSAPMENHDRSDQIGEEILGQQPNAVLKDEAASAINNLRTKVLLNKADLVIAKFGESYKQWNTAVDAGEAVAMGKPLILIRPEKLHHALKELSNKAQVVVETEEQALQTIKYIFESE
ncbi:YtoQ family protein [Scopulibacillus darangshiensis]|uniref:YtoQ family protein n=1 Tax=Scopulibacillus darangshiensis TaxID=442528 RepID=A0A4R2PD68_9BACL|nr:YtoQ family protein [Scopulibacillus darangshiensis]TCP32031.1 YtoQ family protein [Scopulibacillus darangshiensis]